MEILYTKVREKVSDCDIFILLCVSFMCVCALPLKKCTKWDINNHHQVTVYACTLYMRVMMKMMIKMLIGCY